MSKQLLSLPPLWLLLAMAKQDLLGLIITQSAGRERERERAASEILKQLNTCSDMLPESIAS